MSAGDLPIEPSSELPLRAGDEGAAVIDVQQRLVRCGFAVERGGRYDEPTQRAVAAFQGARGIRVDGVCGTQTWAALVEAGWVIGDRLLFERLPMQRGDDVVDLQARLGGLGFLDDRIDGILGPRTRRAVEDFQRNCGLTVDGICGPETVRELIRLGARTPATVKARVVERARLLEASRELTGRVVVVGDLGGVSALADAVERAVHAEGATVVVTTGPDGSGHAREANALDADLFIGLAIGTDSHCAYYATREFSSEGGERLAAALAVELSRPEVLASEVAVAGMRLPVLRETRMPAVVCELGPPRTVVERTPQLAQALRRGVGHWVSAPVTSNT